MQTISRAGSLARQTGFSLGPLSQMSYWSCVETESENPIRLQPDGILTLDGILAPAQLNADPSARAAEFQITSLPALVRMKLIAYRRKDQVHLLDLIGVGLIDATSSARFPPPLAGKNDGESYRPG